MTLLLTNISDSVEKSAQIRRTSLGESRWGRRWVTRSDMALIRRVAASLPPFSPLERRSLVKRVPSPSIKAITNALRSWSSLVLVDVGELLLVEATVPLSVLFVAVDLEGSFLSSGSLCCNVSPTALFEAVLGSFQAGKEDPTAEQISHPSVGQKGSGRLEG